MKRNPASRMPLMGARAESRLPVPFWVQFAAIAAAGTAACAMLLCACAVGPNFTTPHVSTTGYAVPAKPIGPVNVAYGGPVASDWYQLFRSDQLDLLVHEALKGNPDLDAARHSLLAAQDEERAVAGSLYPQVQLDAGARRERVNGSYLFMPINAFNATANQFTIGPSLAYDLDVFGRVRRMIEAQAAQTAQASHEAMNVYITLVNDVVLTAFNLAAAEELCEVTRQLTGDLQAQYDLTKLLEDAGRGNRTDTLQAQAQLESVRASLPQLEKQRDMYANSLRRILGKSPADQLPEVRLKDFKLPQEIPVSLPSQLVRQRPDVLEAEDRLHQASAEIGVAEAARFPAFSISAQYAQLSNMTSNLFTQPGQTWSLGIDVAAPLFEGGTLKAREKEARQRYLQVAAQYRGAVIGAFTEVADAMQALQHDHDRYVALEAALNAARANRDLSRSLFALGKVSELVVLIAEQRFQNAALDHVREEAERFADVAMLFHALGGGWWSAQHSVLDSGADGDKPGASGAGH